MKQEPEPVFSVYNVNTESLENIFSNTLNSSTSSAVSHHDIDKLLDESPANTNDHVDDDDCEVIGEIIPLPLKSTSEGLIKKDDDPLSADKSFITTVRCLLLAICFKIINNHLKNMKMEI